jgi:hypothetical protein
MKDVAATAVGPRRWMDAPKPSAKPGVLPMSVVTIRVDVSI